MTKVALISPRLAVQKGDFLGSGVPYWPIELAVLASFLQKNNRSVEVVDLFGSDPKHLEERSDHYLQGAPLKRFTEDSACSEVDLILLYAISFMSHQDLLEITRKLKSLYPEKPLAVLENSQAVTAYALSSIRADFFEAGANALICGEPYWNWDNIEGHFLNKQPPPPNVLSPDSAANTQPQRIHNPTPSYPFPAWELFPLSHYWALPYSHGPKSAKCYLPMLSSKGCPYPCDFCVVPETNEKHWRARTPEEVVGEMLYLKHKFGVNHFQIEDLNPSINAKRWSDICTLLLEKNTGISFGFVSGTKAETISSEQVELLARAGCTYLSISPESGSTAVLDSIGKRFDHKHALKLLQACKKHSIYTQACILVGHPAETEESHLQSCSYVREMVRAGLDEIAVFVVSSLAGSKLHRNRSIELESHHLLPSFSPKGRANWPMLRQRRKQLIRVFFLEKLKQGLPLWRQTFRALLGRPKTKMENLPRRWLFIYGLILRKHLLRTHSREH